jgi:hypothetical protein
VRWWLSRLAPLIALVAVGATLRGNPVLAGGIFAVLRLGVVIPLVRPWLPVPKRPEGRHA